MNREERIQLVRDANPCHVCEGKCCKPSSSCKHWNAWREASKFVIGEDPVAVAKREKW